MIRTCLIAAFGWAMAWGSMDDDPLRAQLMVDRLEYNGQTRAWDVRAMVGYDWHRLYLYSSGEGEQHQDSLVYSRPLTPFWDLQGGVRIDHTPMHHRTRAEVAVAGLAPYWFETRVSLLVGSGGVAMEGEVAYDVLLTQRMILVPSLAWDVASSGEARWGWEAGVRLRYEIRRQFGPYIGYEIADTTATRHESRWVFGVRWWL